MKAAVLRAFGTPLVLEELPDPQPGAGEVVVDVVAAPVLSYTNEVLSGAQQYPLLLPLAIGVGAVGRVRAVGPDATRIKPGDWVLCDPTVRARDEVVAPDIMLQGWIAPSPGAQRLQAHFRHGAFAEQLLLPLENTIPLGELTVPEASRLAALLTMLVPYGGLLAGNLQAGQTVLISGATGHFGSAAVAVALAMGVACVVAPGRNQVILAELRHRFGSRVRTVILGGDPGLDEQHLRAAAPVPIDLVLDMLPPLPEATLVETAARTVRAHGTVVLMGGLRVDVSFNYAHLMRNNLTIKGQYMSPRDAPARLLALVRAGLLPLNELEISSFSLAQANEAVAHAAAAAGPFRYTVIEPATA